MQFFFVKTIYIFIQHLLFEIASLLVFGGIGKGKIVDALC